MVDDHPSASLITDMINFEFFFFFFTMSVLFGIVGDNVRWLYCGISSLKQAGLYIMFLFHIACGILIY